MSLSDRERVEGFYLTILSAVVAITTTVEWLHRLELSHSHPESDTI